MLWRGGLRSGARSVRRGRRGRRHAARAVGDVSRALGQVRPGELPERQRRIDRLLDAEGAGHLVHELTFDARRPAAAHATVEGTSRPWRLDPIPLVLGTTSSTGWPPEPRSGCGCSRRCWAICRASRRVVRTGVFPPALAYRLADAAADAARTPGRWLVHYAVDVARTAEGEWRVVQDLTDTPPGLGYALLNRSVIARVMPDGVRRRTCRADRLVRQRVASRHRRAAPPGRRSPRTVVLDRRSDAPDVRRALVPRHADGLPPRRGRRPRRAQEPAVAARARGARADRRRLPAGRGRSRSTRSSTAAGPQRRAGMTWAAQHGGVALANGFGTHRARDAGVARTFLAVARRGAARRDVAAGAARPGEELATAPVVLRALGSDSLAPGRVVVCACKRSPRPTASPSSAAASVACSPRRDPPTRPTAQLAKDVWVLGAVRRARVPRCGSCTTPQVDFRASVTKRAAEALYWMGRSAERAEVAARTIRVLGQQVRPGPVARVLRRPADGRTARSPCCVPRSRNRSCADRRCDVAERCRSSSGCTTSWWPRSRRVADADRRVVHEATSVREYLSTTTGRLLGRLAAHPRQTARRRRGGRRARPRARRPRRARRAVDGEHGPRAVVALPRPRPAARAGARPARLGRGRHRPGRRPDVFQPLAESVLSINESLVAYRRRYRSDVELTRGRRPARARRLEPAQPGVPARPAARAHGVARLARGRRARARAEPRRAHARSTTPSRRGRRLSVDALVARRCAGRCSSSASGLDSGGSPIRSTR